MRNVAEAKPSAIDLQCMLRRHAGVLGYLAPWRAISPLSAVLIHRLHGFEKHAGAKRDIVRFSPFVGGMAAAILAGDENHRCGRDVGKPHRVVPGS